MTSKVAELLAKSLELSDSERGELTEGLILSLEPGGSERDLGYEEAWAVEIERRSKEVHDRCDLISREEFDARLNKSLADAQSQRSSGVSTSS